jgi:hypothetical protein
VTAESTPTECNSVGYGDDMTTDKLNDHRDRLRKLRADFDEAAKLPERRVREVDEARAAGMTWREAAELLGMTQNGLIKASQTAARAATDTTD